MEPLDEQQRSAALQELPQWEYREGAIHREFVFANFREAIAFIVRVGFEAEQRNHHPELTNVYNRVGLRFTTHDAGNQLTQGDVDMALAADGLA